MLHHSGTNILAAVNSTNQVPSWHSLSGYLHYRSAEGLGRLFRRRLWFMLEDVQCMLVGFKSAEAWKSGKVKPTVEIDLKTAGVFPNPIKNEEFVIICSDNEHQLRAENHESSVIWLLALQSTRNRCQGARVTTLASTMASASSSPRQSDSGDSYNLTMTSGMKFPWKMKGRSLSMFPCLQSNFSNGKLTKTSILETFKNKGISLDTGIEFYTGSGMFRTEHNPYADTTDSAFSSERVSRTSEWQANTGKSSAAPSVSDDTQFSDEFFVTHQGRNRQRNSSESSFEMSSQQQSLVSKMISLEKQVMNSKSVMARLLNKECCFKEMIDQRDHIIKELLLKIQKLENVSTKSNAENLLKSRVESMQNLMLFHCSEIKQLANLRMKDCEQIEQQQNIIEEMATNLGSWKDNYVYLFQSSISVPSGDTNDKWQLKLFGGDMHKKRVRELLSDARQLNPSLPDYSTVLLKMSHVDQYGFRHEFDSEELLVHYICQQLHLHYRCLYPEHQNYLIMWNEVLAGPSLLSFHAIAGMKTMCRQGIPVQYRSEVWRRLINGKIADLKEEKGSNYFGHLITRAYDSILTGYYRKQIFIDLLRTMPTNVNFCSSEAEGIRKLKEVLQAFSFHNPSIGYCQGLNFVASMCLLFLDTEDAFWALVAITEKYFHSTYFDKGLTGANIDQEIFQEMFAQQLPNLHAHIQKFDLEFSTITINWFLALFIDIVPFETLLRIWDCFLMEGSKVLFRFALAILKRHEELLLEQSDVLGLLKYLKTSTKLLFDVDGLVKTAFEDLKPFPHRQQISSRRLHFEEALKNKKGFYVRKEGHPSSKKFNRQYSVDGDDVEICSLQYLDVASVSYNSIWITSTSQELSKISVFSKNEKKLSSDFQIKIQVLCVCAVGDIILLSTLSSQVYAFSGRSSGELLWSCSLTGTALAICSKVKPHQTTFSIFAALNNGFVAFFEKIPLTPTSKVVSSYFTNCPLYLPVSHCSITSLLLVDPHIWLACENSIHIIHCETLNLVTKFQVSKSNVDFIRTMVLYDPHHTHRQPAQIQNKHPSYQFHNVQTTNFKNQHVPDQVRHGTPQNQNVRAVWLAVEGSSVVQMWHATEHHCMAMYDVSKGLHVIQCKEEEYLNTNRITSLLCVESMLWVGTGSGFIYIFAVSFSAPHYTLLLKKLESFKQMSKIKTRSNTLPPPKNGESDIEQLKTSIGKAPCNFTHSESRTYSLGQIHSPLQNFINRSRLHSSDVQSLDIVEELNGADDEMKEGFGLKRISKMGSQEILPSTSTAVNLASKPGNVSRDQLPDEKFLMNSFNGYLILEAKFKISEKPVRCLTLVDSHPANITICSCSGSYGDEESVLLWKKDPKDHTWNNEAAAMEPSQTSSNQKTLFSCHQEPNQNSISEMSRRISSFLPNNFSDGSLKK